MNQHVVFRNLAKALQTIYSKEEAETIADMVLEKITGQSRSQRIIHADQVLNENQTQLLNKYQNELLQNRPVQYVLGQTEFYGLNFLVDESVLIPRPETEELVDHALDWIREKEGLLASLKILDIGTGSGCIALGLKSRLPNAFIFGTDISQKALKTAQQNAQQNQLDICFLLWDLFEGKTPSELNQLDYIISNPPYIGRDEKDSLAAHVVDFEPNEALFVTNNDPLQFYKRIEAVAHKILKPTGNIFFELHENYAHQTLHFFESKGWDGVLKKDFYGKERMLFLKKAAPQNQDLSHN